MPTTHRIRVIADAADAIELDKVLRNPTVRQICDGVDGLPSPPRVYLELSRIANDPRSSLGDMGRVIESDPGIGASVLQLANSAFFGRMRRMVSIQQAVGHLGVELLKSLVLSAHLARQVGNSAGGGIGGISLSEFQARAIKVARLASSFVGRGGPREVSEGAFTAGMLCDVGELVLALKNPKAYAQVASAASAQKREMHEVEQEVLGITHAELGAYLLSAWGLPALLVECVAFHHKPGWAVSGPLEVRAVVHAADVLVDGREDLLDVQLIHRAGYLDQLDRWRNVVSELEVETKGSNHGGSAVGVVSRVHH